MRHGGDDDAKRRARKLRKELSPAERRLWNVLRLSPGGHRFRKQHPCGVFALDFFCAARGLVVEVDGESHNRGDRPARDVARDLWIAEQGFSTIRIPAVELLRDLDAVVRYVVASADAQPLHQRP